MSAVSVDEIMQRATAAAGIFSQYDQQQTDRIVESVYRAGFAARVRLARFAQEETGIGRWDHKVIKNVVATQFVYEDIRDLKTVGVIREDTDNGILEIAQPVGPILAIIPATNPTSTVMFKVLSALKTRNPVIVSPSRRATACTVEAARICYEAALDAGAPEDCVQWLADVSREQTQALMAHSGLALILATGATGLVHSAYSSGTPTLGVGPGNVPVFIDRSADVPFAVNEICASKLFDNGTICASEQAIVVERALADDVMAAFRQHGAYFLNPAESRQLEALVLDTSGHMSADIVGRPATDIAQRAGLAVPPDTTLLIAPLDGVGDDYPLSREILAPILAFYAVEGFDHAVNVCIDLNFYGGIGHTVSLFCNDEARITAFASLMNAGRIVVNMPSAQGAVGRMYNSLSPSLTLGCGTGGKNITTDNVTARHLINIQRVTRRREDRRFARFDLSLYLDEGVDADAIHEAFNRNY
ncbi:aldehyde dehydrogenase family protein [Methylotetracoccus oryzae]|uniref:aldehyde dehydrogenase family protein n=1 Tax=Methylotetracoccus oryzae TaxID=1919059 RepID=UPI001119478D|nr:aldehyde dehydrogenase family protein [Methylotetracoccus oryzae]